MKRPRKGILTLTLMGLTIAAAVLLVRSLDYLKETPFAWTRAWQSPSAVSVAPDGSLAVVENSKMLVTLTDPQGRLTARIRGGSYDTDSFYYAEHIDTDGAHVVLAEVRHTPNSTFVEAERILRYSMDGQDREVLYEVDYQPEDRPRQLGRILSVHLSKGQTFFTQVEGSTVSALHCEGGSAVPLLAAIVPDCDDVLRASYEPQTGALCLTTKKGLLGVVTATQPLQWLAYGDGVRVPWDADMAPDGTLYVCDLTAESVVALRDGEPPETLWQGGLVYDLTATAQGVAFSDGAGVFEVGGASLALPTVTLAPMFALRLSLTWAAVAYLALAGLWLLYRLVRLMRGQPVSEARRRMLIAAVSVLVTVTLVMAFLLSFLQTQLQEQTNQNLSQLAESISATSGTVFGDQLASIRTLEDYRGPSYTTVKRYMDAFCDASYRNGANLYYVLYRFDDSMLWGVMDYENTTGVHYPYCPLGETPYGEVVTTGKPLRVDGEADIYGLWSYTVAPVFDSAGQTVGLVEIGTNQYGEVVARHTLVREVLTAVLVALLLAMLAFNEFTAFHDHRVQCRTLRAQGDGRVALGFIRALIFLVFMADNMDAAYIPQLSVDLGLASAGFLGMGLASALPMSVQLLMIGLSAFLSGRVLDRSRPRSVLLVGFGLQILGAGLSIAAILLRNYGLFVLAKAVGGLGTGAAVVTCNALPGRATGDAERQWLIAGLNVGVITGVVMGSSVGGYIADYLGYPAAYLGSILCVLAAAGLMWQNLRGVEHLSLEETVPDAAAQRGQAWRFLRNPQVLSFFLMIMLPYMLMMYFKDYLFPLFAAGLGKTESVIGSVMLLGGALAIFLGDVLPGALLDRLGAWNVLRLSNLLCAFALGVFALNPGFETAVLTVCMLGISASFGYAAQGVYYTAMIQRAGIGDGKAMGVFSLFDNLGQTSGPLALSALLFLGAAAECGAIALAATGLLGAVSLVRRSLGGARRNA